MAITFEALAGTLSLRTNDWTSGLSKAEAGLRQFVGGMDRAMAQVSAAAQRTTQAIGAIATASAAAAAESLRVGAGFESSMSRVKALISSTSDDIVADFARLQEAARELGRSTQFSASEVASAMQFMAMAGFETDTILSSLPDTLALAAAGQLSMGQAADIVTNIMSGMGIEASDLGHAVDVLAKAFTTANTDLGQLGQAMKYVGPIAKATGKSLEETIAPLQIMSDAGIQASMAGTSLRAILGKLSSDNSGTVKAFERLGVAIRDEVTGRVRDLPDLIDDMNAAFEKAGSGIDKAGLLMEAFGDRAGPGMATLLDAGGQKLREYEERLADAAGTAGGIAAIQTDNLSGAFVRLGSAVEDIKISIAQELTPAIRAAVEGMTAWVGVNQEFMVQQVGAIWVQLGQGATRAADAFASVFEVIRGPGRRAIETANQLRQSFVAWFETLPKGAQDALLVGGALTGISLTVGSLAGSVPILGGLVAPFVALLNPVGLLAGAVGMLGSAFTMLSGLATTLTGGFGVLAATLSGLFSLLLSFAANPLAGMAAILPVVAGGVLALVKALVVIAAPALAAAGAVAAITLGLTEAMRSSAAARQTLAETFAKIRDAAVALIKRGLEILSEWWEENRERVADLGIALIDLFKAATEVVGPALMWLVENVLPALLWAFGKLVDVLTTAADFMRGDFRRFTIMANDALAMLQRTVAKVLDSLANMTRMLPFVGSALRKAAEAMRQYADENESASRIIQDQIDRESKAREREAKEEARRKQHARELEEAHRKEEESYQRYLEGKRQEAADEELKLLQQEQEAAETLRQERERLAESRAFGFGADDVASGGSAGGGSTAASAGGTGGAAGSGGGPRGGGGGGRQITALDPEAVGREYGASLARLTREHALAGLAGMGRELAMAIKPDGDGAIDREAAETLLQNYRAVFAQIPSFASEQFDEVSAKILGVIDQMGTAAPELRQIYAAQLAGLLGDAEQAFRDDEQQAQHEMDQMAEASAETWRNYAIDTRVKLDAAIQAARQEMGASRDETKQLVELRNQALKVMAEVRSSTGETRKQKIEELNRVKQAWADAYKEIQEGSKATREQQVGDAKAVAGAAETAAQQTVQAVNQQLSGGGQSQAGSGRQSGIGGMMSQISGMGSQLSSMFSGVVTGIGAAGSALARVFEQAKDPIAKLDLQIQNLKARIAGVSHNFNRFGVGGSELQQMGLQLSQLEARRHAELQQRRAEQEAALAGSREAFARHQANRRASESGMGEGYDSVIATGDRAPVQININGVNDVREAFDRVQQELARRGYDRSGRAGKFMRS